ncbi:MAG: hypothetical protein ACKVQW_07395 [Pyrinomonadaceae bacterium]
MVRRLTFLFLLAALLSGVVSGTPLHAPNEKMMSCCDKAKSKERSPAAEATRLCCSMNCSESVPTTPGFASNFAPSGVAVSASIADQIAALFAKKTSQFTAPVTYLRESPLHPPQPTYIRHKSLLI